MFTDDGSCSLKFSGCLVWRRADYHPILPVFSGRFAGRIEAECLEPLLSFDCPVLLTGKNENEYRYKAKWQDLPGLQPDSDEEQDDCTRLTQQCGNECCAQSSQAAGEPCPENPSAIHRESRNKVESEQDEICDSENLDDIGNEVDSRNIHSHEREAAEIEYDGQGKADDWTGDGHQGLIAGAS